MSECGEAGGEHAAGAACGQGKARFLIVDSVDEGVDTFSKRSVGSSWGASLQDFYISSGPRSKWMH